MECQKLICDFSLNKIKKITFNCNIRTKCIFFKGYDKGTEVVFNNSVNFNNYTQGITEADPKIKCIINNCNINFKGDVSNILFDHLSNSNIYINCESKIYFYDYTNGGDEYNYLKTLIIPEGYVDNKINLNINCDKIKNINSYELYKKAPNVVNSLNVDINGEKYKNITIRGVIDKLNLDFNDGFSLITKLKDINIDVSYLVYSIMTYNIINSIKDFKIICKTSYSTDTLTNFSDGGYGSNGGVSVMPVYFPTVNNRYHSKGDPFALYKLYYANNINPSHKITHQEIIIIQQLYGDEHNEIRNIFTAHGSYNQMDEIKRQKNLKKYYKGLDKFAKVLYDKDEEDSSYYAIHKHLRDITYEEKYKYKINRRKGRKKIEEAFKAAGFSASGSENMYYNIIKHYLFNLKNKNAEFGLDIIEELTTSYNSTSNYYGEINRLNEKGRKA